MVSDVKWIETSARPRTLPDGRALVTTPLTMLPAGITVQPSTTTGATTVADTGCSTRLVRELMVDPSRIASRDVGGMAIVRMPTATGRGKPSRAERSTAVEATRRPAAAARVVR